MPREILNEKYDNLDKVDIYSLGVSIYELIKGSSGLHFINLKEGKVPLLPTHSMQLQNLLKTKLLEKVGLLEKEKALWTQEEDSVKQNTAAVSDENTRMRVQVMELGECRNQLSLDKQQLMENLSSLQSRIEDLERSSASAHSSTDITNFDVRHQRLRFEDTSPSCSYSHKEDVLGSCRWRGGNENRNQPHHEWLQTVQLEPDVISMSLSRSHLY